MLVLSRREGESIEIGNGITVTICRIDGKRVRIGINAPQDVPIRRMEIDPQQPKHAEPTVAKAIVPQLPPLASFFPATITTYAGA